MKTIFIRDLRQKWPVVERGRKTSGSMLITRNSKPVARLMPLEPAEASARKRFNPAAQAAWLEASWGKESSAPWVDAALQRDRDDE